MGVIFSVERVALGVIARIGAGLIAAAILCFLLWVAVGGWGPPSPLVFAVIGLIGGGIWAVAFVRMKPVQK